MILPEVSFCKDARERYLRTSCGDYDIELDKLKAGADVIPLHGQAAWALKAH